MTEVIMFGGNEYRSQGGEIQRRPAKEDGERCTLEDRSWLVLNQQEHYVPQEVKAHFAQAKDRDAVD